MRGSVGLTVSLDRSSFTGAGIGTWVPDPSGGEATRAPGGGLLARTYFNRRTALFSFGYVARVKLGGLEGDRSFIEAMVALRRLGDDPAVGGLLLQIDQLDLGLRAHRGAARAGGGDWPAQAGVRLGDEPDTSEYYLASACNRVVVHPAGGLFLGGLAQTVTFFKGTLDRLGVAVDLVRIAEYKGAMEPFVLPEQSAAGAREPQRDAGRPVRAAAGGHRRGRAGRGLRPRRCRR